MKSNNKQLRNEYISRINRVQDYIEVNLENELTLETLASVAHFSPFHFHRIYKALTGETLNQYIQRIRVELAATRLIQRPDDSITVIALDCGFSGSASFARSFKEFYGMSASEWRDAWSEADGKKMKIESKYRKHLSNIRKEFKAISFYIDNETKNQVWRLAMTKPKELETKVEVKEMSEFTVAYIRHIGPYAGDEALFATLFGRLMKWAGPRNLLNFPETKCISIYHDNPSITDDNKLRLDVCISVPPETQVDGEVCKATIPAGKYALARFEILADQYGDAWSTVYGGWLPESGYQPGDGVCYELYHNNPEEHPENKHIFDIVIPVKPM
ncbi:MAG: AraC family transcriptional regulator [candidate division Zixibacteria bacterium]|nr:AraC family transcriptional regulator [candidate division Zixibacteria bacterium]